MWGHSDTNTEGTANKKISYTSDSTKQIGPMENVANLSRANSKSEATSPSPEIWTNHWRSEQNPPQSDMKRCMGPPGEALKDHTSGREKSILPLYPTFPQCEWSMRISVLALIRAVIPPFAIFNMSENSVCSVKGMFCVKCQVCPSHCTTTHLYYANYLRPPQL